MNKIENAKARIAAAVEKHKGAVFLGHSGGKDSQVILHLTQKILPDVKIVHNVKPMLGTSGSAVGALTEMWPETLQFLYTHTCRKNQVMFMKSDKMKQWIKDNNVTCQIDGARIDECNRPGKSSDIIRNGVACNRSTMVEYEPTGIFGLGISYPILDWDNYDVFNYLHENSQYISKEYLKDADYNEWHNATGKWIPTI